MSLHVSRGHPRTLRRASVPDPPPLSALNGTPPSDAEPRQACSPGHRELFLSGSVLLGAFEYVQIDENVVRSALVEPDRLLRSLDAIHLATARLLGPELSALLTYDDRLAKASCVFTR